VLVEADVELVVEFDGCRCLRCYSGYKSCFLR
jgi:hypothetical protein